MAIPGFGDAIGIWDVALRITTFINDLRHAQDDFLGLRAEADCLRICINSLNSRENLRTLYHYISEDQGRDLKSIVANCELNMIEMNVFVASCTKIVDDHVDVYLTCFFEIFMPSFICLLRHEPLSFSYELYSSY
jgi:hypothetical protein